MPDVEKSKKYIIKPESSGDESEGKEEVESDGEGEERRSDITLIKALGLSRFGACDGEFNSDSDSENHNENEDTVDEE